MNQRGLLIFRRLLAIVYLLAFASAFTQIEALLGLEGLLPAAARIKHAASSGDNFLTLPTLFWFFRADLALKIVCAVGMISSILALLGFYELIGFAVCYLCYLSVVNVGQVFFQYQWDYLLLETGLIVLCFAPLRRGTQAPYPGLGRALVMFLLFRLMFSSGVVKLLSGDQSWWSLTALSHHFETQPLPNPLAYFASKLPDSLLRAATSITLLFEIAIPFCLFASIKIQRTAALIFIMLQLLILLTGNFAFFNLLTIALCLPTFDSVEPEFGRSLRALYGYTLAICAALNFASQFSIALPSQFNHFVRSYAVTSHYGLFAVMTTERREIVLEGSVDGENWSEIEFRYKPGDLQHRPPIIAPFQPRLDWQLWFAALSSPKRHPWFARLIERILEGDPATLALLKPLPFGENKPIKIRAQLYRYRFSSLDEWWNRGNWWTREYLGPYLREAELQSQRMVQIQTNRIAG